MNKHKFVVVGAVIGTLAVGGIAAALWSSSATGPGRAGARTAQTVTVAAVTGAADLYPGFTGGDVYFTLANTNPYPIEFTLMTAGTVTSSNPTNCPVSGNVSVVGASGLTLAVAANATSGTLSIADVVSMTAAAPDGCQGVTFTIPLTLTGSQV